jgi:hypothetical protein
MGRPHASAPAIDVFGPYAALRAQRGRVLGRARQSLARAANVRGVLWFCVAHAGAFVGPISDPFDDEDPRSRGSDAIDGSPRDRCAATRLSFGCRSQSCGATGDSFGARSDRLRCDHDVGRPGSAARQTGYAARQPRYATRFPRRRAKVPSLATRRPRFIQRWPGRVARQSGLAPCKPGRAAFLPGLTTGGPGRVARIAGRVARIPGRVAESPRCAAERPSRMARLPSHAARTDNMPVCIEHIVFRADTAFPSVRPTRRAHDEFRCVLRRV